ncbi:MAG: RNA 2',3'-cyclic phosphodiesterase [Marinilabiliales bacterium]|nr:MAG: RNA 2',3'-cyclic phosphodiesterase [Marinilabiliales bacterium]
MRLFIAIPLPLFSLSSKLPLHFQQQLKKDHISWTKPENFHLTLLFLGETNEKLIPEIMERLEEITYNFDPFNLTIEKTGLFGSAYDPKVIWAGAEPSGMLQDLHFQIANTMEAVGYKADRQNFVPHLTIGRIKRLNDKKQLQNALDARKAGHFFSQRVEEIALFESQLTNEGPKYNIKGVSTLGC